MLIKYILWYLGLKESSYEKSLTEKSKNLVISLQVIGIVVAIF
jgi:hypothetical protein